MQEKTKPVFVIATANSIDRLPGEFLRKGRFDEIFFVDLPTHPERVAVWRVHLQRVAGGASGTLELSPALLEGLAERTEGFSGAEIEQAVVAGLFEAYDARRPLVAADLHGAVRTTVPLSVTQSEQIARLRAWADVRGGGHRHGRPSGVRRVGGAADRPGGPPGRWPAPRWPHRGLLSSRA